MSPLTTPLHALHQRLGARLVDFSGWELPVQYEGVLAEHQWCRSQAALFDTSHMGQFVFRGPGAPMSALSPVTLRRCHGETS